MTADPVRAIAEAVLYEGYILWPYRRSALKNQRRFTFGGVYPPEHSERHPDDRCRVTTEVLLEAAPDAQVDVSVRFLQVLRRIVARVDGERLREVDELVHEGELYLTWEEACEREIHAPGFGVGPQLVGRTVPISIEAGREREALGEEAALVRAWPALSGEIQLQATPVATATWRISVSVANLTPFAGADREEAVRLTFCSTHARLQARGGAFVSMSDPGPLHAAQVAACRNIGLWPALVGDPERRDQVLGSPIILEDFPRIAPESPGDLFDGGEIDQLLVLNILAMTEEEKAEMAATDPRAREILERTEALTPQQLMALHGTIRELGMAR